MTVYQDLSTIKNALLTKIEQHSDKEQLNITIQVEEYEFGSDTVVLLFDASDLLLLDMTYTENHTTTSQATAKARELHVSVMDWVTDYNVDVNEKIKEVCY